MIKFLRARQIASPEATEITAPTPKLTLIDDGLNYGGGQIGLRRYIEVPSDLERSVVLLTPNPMSAVKPADEVEVAVIQQRTGRGGLIRAWRHLLRAPAERKGVRGVVVANSLMAAVVLSMTLKRHRTFVYYLREDLSPEWIGGAKRLLLAHLFLPRFDAFLANSEWTASTLPANLRRKPLRVAYPLCGVSADVDRSAARSDEGSSAIRLLSLSRIAEWKGIDVVLDAAEALAQSQPRPVVLTIAGAVATGDESYARRLRGRPAASNLTVKYTGHVDDISPLLSSHDILLACSRHPEPFGQVIVQGLAAGLPLIATNHEGPGEILADEPTARLVPPNDVAATVTALFELIDHAVTGPLRTEAAARAGRRFSDTQMAYEFEAAIHQLMCELKCTG